jgi:hypothetical protein
VSTTPPNSNPADIDPEFARYTASFATKLCSFIRSFATPTSRIAFLCCPTSYVAFQNQSPLPDVWLLEYDGRFGLLGNKFVHYDLEEPDKIPKHLWNTVDIAIADPPFLNEVRMKKSFSPSLSLISGEAGSSKVIN